MSQVLKRGLLFSCAVCAAALWPGAGAADDPGPDELRKLLDEARTIKSQRPALYGDAVGLLIVEMLPDGQASALGLRVGDVLLRYDGQALTTAEQLTALVTGVPPSSRVSLELLRAAEPQRVEAAGGLLGVYVSEMDSPAAGLAVLAGREVRRGNHEHAARLLDEALTRAREEGDRRGEAVTFSARGYLAYHTKDYPQSLADYARSLALERAIGNTPRVAEELRSVGFAHFQLGQAQQAEEHFRGALELKRELGDRRGEAEVLGNLGGVHWGAGEFARAAELYEQALALWQELGDEKQTASFALWLAMAHGNAGNHRGALPSYQEASTAFARLGDAASEATALVGVGSSSFQQGDHRAALTAYSRALAIHRELGDDAQVAASLRNVGIVHDRLGDFEKAIAHLDEALTVRNALGDAAGEATLAGEIAGLYWARERFAEAADRHEHALAIWRKVGNRKQQTASLHQIGVASAKAGQRDRAIAAYREELELLTEPGDEIQRAGAAVNLAGLEVAAGEYALALEHASEAHETAVRTQNAPMAAAAGRVRAGALLGLSGAAIEAGDWGTAIVHAEQALPIARSVDERTLETLALKALCVGYGTAELHPKALQACAAVLPRVRETGNRAHEREVLVRLGVARTMQSELRQAREDLQAAIELARADGNRLAEATAAGFAGAVDIFAGRLGEGIHKLEGSRKALQELGEPLAEAAMLAFSGFAYMSVSRYTESVAAFEAALALYRQHGNPRSLTLVLTPLAYVNAFHLSRGEEASAHAREALQIHRDLGNRDGEALLLALLALAQAREGNSRAAADLTEQALAAARESEPTGNLIQAFMTLTAGKALVRDYAGAEALVREGIDVAIAAGEPLRKGLMLAVLGAVLEIGGEHERAVPELRKALRETAALPDLHWQIWAALGRSWRALGHTELAAWAGKNAVNGVQALRGNVRNLDLQLQETFLADRAQVYGQVADLLIAQGRLPEAEQVLAMLKEQEYFDFVRRSAADDVRDTRAGYVAWEVEWSREYEALTERLTALGEELGALESQAQVGLSDAEAQRRAELEDQLDAAALAFEEYLDRLLAAAEASEGDRAREVGEQNLEDAIALQETLASAGEGTVLVHYVMLGDRLHILLTTPFVQLARQQAVGEEKLNEQVHALRRALQDPASDVREPARELYTQLLAPIADDLENAEARTLLVSLDGALRYVPMAALHDGEGYVAERYRTVVFTAATRDKLGPRDRGTPRVAGLGLTQAHPGFSALPAVGTELDGIVRRADRADEEGVMPGEILLDDAFTPAAFQDVLDRRYPLLHVASHFSFNPGTDADSFLLLGDGTHLSLADLRSRRYRFRNVDLLTLSACNTAVGQQAEGTEVEGFGVLAQRQGAAGVMATLWPVADASTGRFMQQFYRLLAEQPELDKAQALQQTQRRFLRGEITRDGSGEAARGIALDPASSPGSSPRAAASDWSHPYYWAPFILMGNWL